MKGYLLIFISWAFAWYVSVNLDADFLIWMSAFILGALYGNQETIGFYRRK